MSGISDPQPIEQSRPSDDSDIAYVGYRRQGHAIAGKQPDQEQLAPERTFELANHSPNGFSRGYAGNEPAQLALTLLLGYIDGENVTPEEYMEFKTKVMSQLERTEPDDCWRLAGREIDIALHETVGEPVAPSVN